MAEKSLVAKYGFRWEQAFAAKLADIEFPPFTGIQINMMPIVMGDASSIPEEYRAYAPLVERCITTPGPGTHRFPGGRELRNAVGFLSVWETIVSPGESQRRPGLHVEASPDPTLAEEDITPCDVPGRRGILKIDRSHEVKIGAAGGGLPYHHWGGRDLGLYQASTVANTCRIWNARVQHPGPLGDCEELRAHLGEDGTFMGANELWWLTDLTPHESLPVLEETPRQWFRLVSQDVTVWYEQHSTPNPLVPLPDHIHVATHNKFGDDLVKAASKIA
mmetsp:Transcript_34510/g.74572  ORF Transcript_34510/g.74572 Transcript_34510/m.74572 type:complete len:276 (-) Transcript_34510:46-873(-)